MVMFGFWIGAMVLCLIALALLLPPLLRRDDHERRRIERELAVLKRRLDAGELEPAAYATQRQTLSDALVAELERNAPAPARPLAVALALLVPVGALALYLKVGQPGALDPQHTRAPMAAAVGEGTPQQMDQAIASLEQRLRAQPDQVDGWLLLARSYRATERFPDMLRATTSAMALAPTRPDVMVEHAEALALNSPTRRFDAQARDLLDQALATDDRHQKALWLLGVAELQDGRSEQGLAYWQRLSDLLPSDDPLALRIAEQIAAARTSNAFERPTAATQTTAAGGPQIRITVEIDPDLADRVDSGDTLFVYARNPSGGPPLAIRRLSAREFPVQVTLSQAERMLDGMQIEADTDVALGARISRSGDAQPRPGDLQAPSQTHAVAANGASAVLRISEVVGE